MCTNSWHTNWQGMIANNFCCKSCYYSIVMITYVVLLGTVNTEGAYKIAVKHFYLQMRNFHDCL